MEERARGEIAHGRWLAEKGAETLWGWATPAGRIRAERRARLVTELGRVKPESHVLEIGCGAGMFTEMFAETGARIVAVDISPELLETARRRGVTKGRVEFVQARLEDWSTDVRFDAVIGSSILHHLDVPAALKKLHELLRPGGYLGLAEPNMLNPQVFMERRFRRFFPYVSKNETAFVRWQLARVLEESGFTDVHIVPFDWLHPATPQHLIPIVSGLSRVLERIWLVRELAGSLAIQAIRT